MNEERMSERKNKFTNENLNYWNTSNSWRLVIMHISPYILRFSREYKQTKCCWRLLILFTHWSFNSRSYFLLSNSAEFHFGVKSFLLYTSLYNWIPHSISQIQKMRVLFVFTWSSRWSSMAMALSDEPTNRQRIKEKKEKKNWREKREKGKGEDREEERKNRREEREERRRAGQCCFSSDHDIRVTPHKRSQQYIYQNNRTNIAGIAVKRPILIPYLPTLSRDTTISGMTIFLTPHSKIIYH